jgi:phosphatidate cytidylyltransferase
MKPIVTRSLSGIVYVSLILFAILHSSYAFGIIFIIISALTTYEFHKLTNQQVGINVNIWLAVLESCFLFAIFFGITMTNNNYLPTYFIIDFCPYIYILLLLSMFIFEIFRKHPNPVNNIAYFVLGQFYIAVPFAFTTLIFVHRPIFLLAIFVIIWANDTFAYLVGSALGRHKICERISPKKSWEGFAGGLFSALFAGYIFSLFVPKLNLYQWFGFALILVIFGTFGDLFESLIKRTIGVKDSGYIMPGHGGLLDRLDSIIFSVIPLCIYLLGYL